MTPELRAELMRLDGDIGMASCAAMLDRVMALSTPQERATMRRMRVTRVSLDGDRAVIRVAHSSVTSSEPGYVRRVNGRWLVDTSTGRDPAVPGRIARVISEQLEIPMIGIGAGAGTDG